MTMRVLGRVFLYDTTLRDGSQRKGISFSLSDKLKIAQMLCDLGVSYIEGGWPGSNPKDQEYFRQVRKFGLKQTKQVAFGSTRRKGIRPNEDLNLDALLRAETPSVALVGKTWSLHVESVLETTEAENLAMISESVAYLKQEGREVIYDAEHFFDGFKADKRFALETLAAALAAGADWLTLCDTNGGTLPSEVTEVVAEVAEWLHAQDSSARLGIHTHNDAEVAVANSLAAVLAGAEMVQGTMNGYGERTGNANLVSLIPNLQLKLQIPCIPPASLTQLTEVSRRVAELANIAPDTQAPYVGAHAFAHKGGIHVAAVEKISASYEHIDPRLVGNEREIVVSELSGRGNIRMRASSLDVKLQGLEADVLQQVKDLEHRGFQFESAEASFELLLLRAKGGYRTPFEVLDWMVVNEFHSNVVRAQALVKLFINGTEYHTAAQAEGPVNALDAAFRKALEPVFPHVRSVRLTDYKVRILDPEAATGAMTRVIIDATEVEWDDSYEYRHRQSRSPRTWSTVGCSVNVIAASFEALAQSYEYFLSVVDQQQQANGQRAVGAD